MIRPSRSMRDETILPSQPYSLTFVSTLPSGMVVSSRHILTGPRGSFSSTSGGYIRTFGPWSEIRLPWALTSSFRFNDPASPKALIPNKSCLRSIAAPRDIGCKTGESLLPNSSTVNLDLRNMDLRNMGPRAIAAIIREILPVTNLPARVDKLLKHRHCSAPG